MVTKSAVTDSTPAHAAVSFLGPMPGISSQEAALVVAGECAQAPCVPLLAQRGPSAHPVGRMSGILNSVSSDFCVSAVPSGWRLTGGVSNDTTRAQSYLSEDLDAMEENLNGFSGFLTLSIIGPISWGAAVEEMGGEKLIRDHGALRELSIATAQAVAILTENMAKRFPRAKMRLQIDEPLVMDVTQGMVPTASGLRTYVALDRQFVMSLWNPLFELARDSQWKFGVNATAGSVPLSDEYVSLLQSSQANVFYDPRKSGLLGDLVDSGVDTYWFKSSSLDSRRAALDIAALLESLGFSIAEVRGRMLIVPENAFMTGAWPEARNALTAAKGTIDLLNDEDRLLAT